MQGGTLYIIGANQFRTKMCHFYHEVTSSILDLPSWVGPPQHPPSLPVQPVTWCLWDPRGVACPRPSSPSPQSLPLSPPLHLRAVWSAWGWSLTSCIKPSKRACERGRWEHDCRPWGLCVTLSLTHLSHWSGMVTMRKSFNKANRLEGGHHFSAVNAGVFGISFISVF